MFQFTTRIKFDNNVKGHIFMLRCIPGNYQFQRIYEDDISIFPEVTCTFGEDSFGNKTVLGKIDDSHDIFEYKVNGNALISEYKSAEQLDRIYLYETTTTHMSEEMCNFANTISENDNDIHHRVFIISNAVHNKLQYVSKSTNVNTTAAEAFEQGMGVCQDYAHITIALLRNFGIPARYCVGLMLGEGETHAWVEYYDGSMWYGIDPTNDKKIQYGYIKISSGRDCLDCGVNRGGFVSESEVVNQDIQVSVKVGELSD